MKTPKYRKHSTRDFGFVEVDGVRHRLPGRYDSPESRKAYQVLVADLRRKQPSPPIVGVVTVAHVVALYLRHGASHYRSKWGRGEYITGKSSLRDLLQVFGDTPAAEFGPKSLRAYRDRLVEKGQARSTVNLAVGRVRRAFRLAVAEEIVPASVWEGLRSLPSLQPGRTTARETAPRRPVAWSVVEATLAELPAVVAAMVQVQWWVGCRSESLCLAQRSQFDTSTQPWSWRPRHKTEHLRELVLPIGPRAQKHLLPYLEHEPFVFQPRMAGGSTSRYNDHYSPITYGACIKRAAERAGVEHWTPHQLRHARATELRAKYGIEAASAVIGHERLVTTEVYAQRSLTLAQRIALESG